MPEETIENNQIEIVEEVQEETSPISLDEINEELGTEEFELVKKQGLIPEEEKADGEHKEQSKDDSKEDKTEQNDEEEINPDPDNFEEMDKVLEKDEKKFHETYTPNQKALYFKSKANIKKRQDAVKERDEALKKLEELNKDNPHSKKLKKIADLLANKDTELTVEMLQSIINEQEPEVKAPINEEAKLNELREKVTQKNYYAEQIGLAKHKNFIKIAQLANELYQSDRPNGPYRSAIDSAYTDEVDEAGLVQTIVTVAKLHPKFNEISEEVDSEKKNTVDRVIKNSKKKISSASVPSSGSRRIVNYDDLTIQDLARLPQDQYTKVPVEVRKRILSQS